ncbi:hypothetical protein [Candidatus Neptunichlamydia sp. REUL1]|uniref:hypothetical protein n=1 Tax=Candidatus Neptunichlamydia sp. REUL1 TaxID=3064277 RepID=UPI002930EB31|nr:hypothetical protein [Candidatus Neptunochlamydia sp. REUL1]
MIPEKISEENNRLSRDKRMYPPFIVKGLASIREEIRIEEATGKSIPYNPTKITDFLQLIRTTWVISNAEYQERFWVRQEPPMMGDNYMETLETFLSNGEAVLLANDAGRVSMTAKQREMLQRLYTMVDDFDGDPTVPDDPGYGLNDSAIIADPKWHKIQAYAKLVYEEITGDDLDAWEKSRPPREKRPEIKQRDATPEEIHAEEKKIYPSFLIEQFKRRQHIPETSLEHCLINVYLEIWTISKQEYQERFWVRKEFPLYDEENCMKTCSRYLCDVITVIHGAEDNKLDVTNKQCKVLKKLSKMIEDFKKDPNRPNNPGYGINDGEIIAYKKWKEIQWYAKSVYEELTGEKA